MANNVKFAVRGDAFDARRSYNGAECGVFGPVTFPAIVTPGSPPAGLIGDSYIDLYGGTGNAKSLLYVGRDNTSETAAMSFHVRVSFQDTGLQGVFTVGGPHSTAYPYRLYLYFNANTLTALIAGPTGATVATLSGAFTPDVGTFYDLILVDPGTTTSNGVKIYSGTDIIAETTRSEAELTTPNINLHGIISLGGITFDVTGVTQWVNEVNIFNYAIDPTAVELESGTGAMGTARTSFVLAPAFDATANIDPGVANVREAVNYMIDGEPLVGTFAPLTAGEIADAVWDEALSGHTTTTTFGGRIQKLLTLAKFLGLK